MSELKECPFCGKEVELHEDDTCLWFIACENCLCHFISTTKEHGFKVWNTRHERTCKVEHVKSGTLYDVWRYTCCGYEHSESRTDAGASEIPLNFCPDCGARVVEMK